MKCPDCGEELEYIEGSSDSRQEWFTEDYYCRACANNPREMIVNALCNSRVKCFRRKVIFKIQSDEIDTDELELIDDTYNYK